MPHHSQTPDGDCHAKGAVLKIKAAVSVALLSIGSAQATEIPLNSKTPEELAAMLFPVFAKLLKDPDSARYINVHKFVGHGDKNVICGQVNAKNPFGAYTGYKMFIVNGNDNTLTIQPEFSGTDVSQVSAVNEFVAKFRELCN
jgi:hypothetical protein